MFELYPTNYAANVSFYEVFIKIQSDNSKDIYSKNKIILFIY